MVKTFSGNASIKCTIPSNEAVEMMETPIPNGSFGDVLSSKDADAADVNNSSDTEEENEKPAQETLVGGAKPPIESDSSLWDRWRLAWVLSVAAFLIIFVLLPCVIVMFAMQITQEKNEKIDEVFDKSTSKSESEVTPDTIPTPLVVAAPSSDEVAASHEAAPKATGAELKATGTNTENLPPDYEIKASASQIDARPRRRRQPG